jgi:hypothetical protein
MEGWRQGRLGSKAGTHREKEKNKNIHTGKEKRKTYLTLTGLLMEGVGLVARRKYLNESEREGINGHYVQENRNEVEHKTTMVAQGEISKRPREPDKQQVKG